MKTSILESALRKAHKVLRESNYPNLERYVLAYFGEDAENYLQDMEYVPKNLLDGAERFLKTHNPKNDEIDIDEPDFIKLAKTNPDARAFKKAILMISGDI
jgi:hypothetical protein